MNWKIVKEENPPIGKIILIGKISYEGSSNQFYWFTGKICRPYDSDEKYNPNYLYITQFKIEEELELSLSPYDYWMEIEDPNNPDIS